MKRQTAALRTFLIALNGLLSIGCQGGVPNADSIKSDLVGHTMNGGVFDPGGWNPAVVGAQLTFSSLSQIEALEILETTQQDDLIEYRARIVSTPEGSSARLQAYPMIVYRRSDGEWTLVSARAEETEQLWPRWFRLLNRIEPPSFTA